MIDFMANIKNKKSMKKYNVKTLAEIAVLCIFCDNIQVWSMNGQGDGKSNQEKKPAILIKRRLERNHLNSMNSGGQVDLNLRSERLETKDYLNGSNENCDMENFSENVKVYKKKLWGDKNENYENILELLFFNKKGHLSLCCCFNYFNGNMGNHGLLKLRKIEKKRRRNASECSENSKNIESPQKSELPDSNNFVYRPVRNEQIITLNDNDKSFTNNGQEDPNLLQMNNIFDSKDNHLLNSSYLSEKNSSSKKENLSDNVE